MISPPMSAGGRLRAGREPLSHSGHHRPATAWRPMALVQGPRTPRIRPNVVRDAYVTMPNHVHAILVIETWVSRTGASPAQPAEHRCSAWEQVPSEWVVFIHRDPLGEERPETNAIGRHAVS